MKTWIETGGGSEAFVLGFESAVRGRLVMKQSFPWVQVQVQFFTQRPRNGRIKLCNCANRVILCILIFFLTVVFSQSNSLNRKLSLYDVHKKS